MEEPTVAFIKRVSHLPPSPRVLIRLLEVSNKPDKDVNEVVQLITHDPSLTAEVLKRCNSAYFAGQQPAGAMFEAVSRLGFQEVYNTVLALFANEAILHPGYSPHVEILWRHSVAVAVAAGVLAEAVKDSVAHAFTAGLLHEVGKVIMVSSDAVSYAEAVEDTALMRRPVLDTEKEHFGFDHAELGACLLEYWKLPPDLVAAVRHHHHLEGAGPFERLAAEVHLANIIAHATGEKFAAMPKGWEKPPASMGILHLTQDKIDSLLPAMREGLGKARSLTPG